MIDLFPYGVVSLGRSEYPRLRSLQAKTGWPFVGCLAGDLGNEKRVRVMTSSPFQL